MERRTGEKCSLIEQLKPIVIMQLKNEDLEKAREIRTYLAIHYQEQYNIDHIAKMFEMSKRRLKLAFKEIANEDVYSFLTKVRIGHAKVLLLTTDEDIESIAARVGLNKSKFIIQFKKIIGRSPSKWRKNPVPSFKLYFHNPE